MYQVNSSMPSFVSQHQSNFCIRRGLHFNLSGQRCIARLIFAMLTSGSGLSFELDHSSLVPEIISNRSQPSN